MEKNQMPARTSRSTAERTSKIGRPRASGQVGDDDPRKAILAAAAELFSQAGYARTSTRAIAEQAGLRQPSMFHYFKTKEDLLAELLETLTTPTTELVTILQRTEAEPATKLYALTFGDVLNMASTNVNMTTLQFLSDARTSRFDAFWSLRTQLFDGYSTFISEGLADSTLTCRSEAIARSVVFGIADSVALWENADSFEPRNISIEVADAVMAYLLRDKGTLEVIRTDALALFAQIKTEWDGATHP